MESESEGGVGGVWGEVKSIWEGCTAPPFPLCKSGSPTRFSSSPAAAVSSLWSCCHGDVGQSADVQAQCGFGAGRGVQTARTGAGSILWLNLGHQDSPQQRQAEAQVTAEGVQGGGRGGGCGWRPGLGNTGSHINGLMLREFDRDMLLQSVFFNPQTANGHFGIFAVTTRTDSTVWILWLSVRQLILVIV